MTFKNKADYIQQTFAPETPLLTSIRESVTDDIDRISVQAQEGKLLQVLIKMSGIKTIVEIGTLFGYSALWMAEALPEDGKIITVDHDERRAEIAAKNFKDQPKIHPVIGMANDILPDISKQGPFDMAFIDADKVNYLNYLNWAEENVRKGGLIIGDNTFLFDTVWKGELADTRVRTTTWNAMKEFNQRLANPDKYMSILLPTEQGMTVAIKLF